MLVNRFFLLILDITFQTQHFRICNLTQRCFHNVVTMPDNWLYRCCPFVESEIFTVDNVETTLKSDLEATLWQRRAKLVTTLQSHNFTKCFKPLSNVAPASLQLIFWHSQKASFMEDDRHLNVKRLLKTESQHLLHRGHVDQSK